MTLFFPFCLSKHVFSCACLLLCTSPLVHVSSCACLNSLRYATPRLHRLRLVCAIDPVERHRNTTGLRDCSCATAPIFGIPTSHFSLSFNFQLSCHFHCLMIVSVPGYYIVSDLMQDSSWSDTVVAHRFWPNPHVLIWCLP